MIKWPASRCASRQPTAYDVADHVAPTRFTHDEGAVQFRRLVARPHGWVATPPWRRLAQIVRGADTDRLDLTPQSGGLVALSLGMSRVESDVHRMLDAM
ncbi:MAG: chromate resistance protein, partial [Rhodoferax sp.]|nr:chromate resistance protein [Rhodoferax sp.]